MGPASVKASTCESPSKMFKGICLLQSDCANICLREGFADGKCHGFRRRCVCTKQCWSPQQNASLLLVTWLIFFFSFLKHDWDIFYFGIFFFVLLFQFVSALFCMLIVFCDFVISIWKIKIIRIDEWYLKLCKLCKFISGNLKWVLQGTCISQVVTVQKYQSCTIYSKFYWKIE